MPVMEVTRLLVDPRKENALRDARPGFLKAFEARPGFVRADLVRLADGEWLDLIEWETSDDLAESKRRGGDSPEVLAFFTQIDEVLTSVEGELVRPR